MKSTKSLSHGGATKEVPKKFKAKEKIGIRTIAKFIIPQNIGIRTIAKYKIPRPNPLL